MPHRHKIVIFFITPNPRGHNFVVKSVPSLVEIGPMLNYGNGDENVKRLIIIIRQLQLEKTFDRF